MKNIDEKRVAISKDDILKMLSVLSFSIALVVYGIPMGIYSYILAGIGIWFGKKGNKIIGLVGALLNVLYMTTLINYLGSFGL